MKLDYTQDQEMNLGSLAKTFSSQISVENEAGTKVNGTSLLKLLSLGIKKRK